MKANDTDDVSGARGRLVTWCTFGQDVTYEPLVVMKLLDFNPSDHAHHYKIVLYQMTDEDVSVSKTKISANKFTLIYLH